MKKCILFIVLLTLSLGGCKKQKENNNCYQVKSLGVSWFKEGAVVVEFTDQNQSSGIPEVNQRQQIALFNVPDKFQPIGTIFYITLHYDASKDVIDKNVPTPMLYAPVKVYIADSASEKSCSIN